LGRRPATNPKKGDHRVITTQGVEKIDILSPHKMVILFVQNKRERRVASHGLSSPPQGEAWGWERKRTDTKHQNLTFPFNLGGDGPS